ncbi:PBP superfamily domain protein [Oxobacter pfennigii]|uniref:PBP superfamily domain protein n=1 Tax=Oxobacter pfennigii TaxID=36849 RepID=A0A0P8YGF4_9CLOT|nr:substrate-binding domain-containing protein [Oxobacter pfennigii]KPU46114.1 PBP superfamily domain protein [Oxobacter pfennigii]
MKSKLKSIVSVLAITAALLLMLVGCGSGSNTQPTPTPTPETTPPVTEAAGSKSIIMATTTSTQDSGLLDYLLPIFTQDTGIEPKVVAVGTGQAIKLGEAGDADVLLVHAKAQEEAFVSAGHGLERFDVMYNDFILIGPKDDPAKVNANAGSDISKALEFINNNKITFISRGDESGTHTMEKNLWKGINITPEGDWYVSAGKGMGAVIQMADEKKAYTIADRATYLAMRDDVDLGIIVEGDSKLQNQYGVIAVNPNKNTNINAEGAQKFIEWILSDKVQGLISEFGKDKYGQSLFIPNAK